MSANRIFDLQINGLEGECNMGCLGGNWGRIPADSRKPLRDPVRYEIRLSRNAVRPGQSPDNHKLIQVWDARRPDRYHPFAGVKLYSILHIQFYPINSCGSQGDMTIFPAFVRQLAECPLFSYLDQIKLLSSFGAQEILDNLLHAGIQQFLA